MYIVSCSLLPKTITHLLESAIRKYWWGNGSGSYIAWVSWLKLRRDKASSGLGFRDLRSFNLALLAKQGSRLLTSPDSLLGRIFKARYYPNQSFLHAKLGHRPSATWPRLLKANEFLVKGIRKHIRNGNLISIREDTWVIDEASFRILTPRPDPPMHINSVSDLINPNWKRLWHLKLPPKIKMFLWRDCSHILPHQANLFRSRIVNIDASVRTVFELAW